MNYVALILVAKIIAWIGLSISTLCLAARSYGAWTYPGSKQQLLDEMRGVRRVMIWKFQLAVFLTSLFTIAALWSR
jgi:hypothetical protein